jgi:hypothetical protein
MIHVSMRHTSTGRKKKTNYWTKPKKQPVSFKPYKPEKTLAQIRSEEHREKYPSMDISSTHTPNRDDSWKKDISSSYTIAPAYNKGAYQVIGKDNIKDIGK